MAIKLEVCACPPGAKEEGRLPPLPEQGDNGEDEVVADCPTVPLSCPWVSLPMVCREKPKSRQARYMGPWIQTTAAVSHTTGRDESSLGSLASVVRLRLADLSSTVYSQPDV